MDRFDASRTRKTDDGNGAPHATAAATRQKNSHFRMRAAKWVDRRRTDASSVSSGGSERVRTP